MKDGFEKERKKWAEIVAKAWLDPKFKQRLINHPKEVFKEMNLSLENSMTYKVLENTSSTTYFVLPAKPEGAMSEIELKKVAAAGWSIPFCG